MQLPCTVDGEVTPLAVARAVTGLGIKTLAARVGVRWQDLRDWEVGEARLPSPMAKRLGLAMGMYSEDTRRLSGPNRGPDEAYDLVVAARQRIVENRNAAHG